MELNAGSLSATPQRCLSEGRGSPPAGRSPVCVCAWAFLPLTPHLCPVGTCLWSVTSCSAQDGGPGSQCRASRARWIPREPPLLAPLPGPRRSIPAPTGVCWHPAHGPLSQSTTSLGRQPLRHSDLCPLHCPSWGTAAERASTSVQSLD